MIIQQSIHINASKEELWPYMTEPEKILQWYTNFKKFAYTSEVRQGVGTTFYVEEKGDNPLPLAKINFKATEWVENEVISFFQESGSVLKVYTQEWRIESENSTCRFTLKEEIQMPYGFIGKLVERVGKSSSESTIQKMLAILKELVEGD
jgi:uncharacterized protein YndB with AHSA1/START domain